MILGPRILSSLILTWNVLGCKISWDLRLADRYLLTWPSNLWYCARKSYSSRLVSRATLYFMSLALFMIIRLGLLFESLTCTKLAGSISSTLRTKSASREKMRRVMSKSYDSSKRRCMRSIPRPEALREPRGTLWLALTSKTVTWTMNV
jgi:hypothetical protein